ncbi:hypothetical protein [Vibrio phage 2 TSL-2019]|uniref:Uncharacterized protein n=1 Tax=Vibrio phage 2 TSL-2019 TaxID=2508172 RepID=A0A513PWN7_9CAUD|nr:hypothetical protein HWC03_gp209 [Vibrio phage 2 TSL-2019]QAU04364.1 hypothetical protein [Vibrio phage 2 TSL-2019]
MKDYVNVQPKNIETKAPWYRSNGVFTVLMLVSAYVSLTYGNW